MSHNRSPVGPSRSLPWSAKPYRARRLGRVTLLPQQREGPARSWVRYVGVRQGAEGERREPGRERLPHLLDIRQHLGDRVDHGLAVVPELVEAGRVVGGPALDHLDVALEVELHAPG